MQLSDMQDFFKCWDAQAKMYDKTIDNGPKQMAFKLLHGYELADIKLALRRHMLDPEFGRFMPKVADVVRQIQIHAPNQFPGSEEAWAMFPRDESQSACICDEMAAAWGVASQQDEIAGRMAFREKYQREVARAKAQGRQPRWFVSCGSDQSHREQVALDAVRNAQISPAAAVAHLPHIPVADLQLLAQEKTTANCLLEKHAQTVGSVDQLLLAAPEEAMTSPEETKAKLAGLMQLLKAPQEAVAS